MFIFLHDTLKHHLSLNYIVVSGLFCGSGSSVGIATDYGLDGPGSNPEFASGSGVGRLRMTNDSERVTTQGLLRCSGSKHIYQYSTRIGNQISRNMCDRKIRWCMFSTCEAPNLSAPNS